MKHVERSPLADPETAARKLVDLANAAEAVQDSHIYIERINAPFLAAGGSAQDFRADLKCAIAKGWLPLHESGTFVKFTEAGALPNHARARRGGLLIYCPDLLDAKPQPVLNELATLVPIWCASSAAAFS